MTMQKHLLIPDEVIFLEQEPRALEDAMCPYDMASDINSCHSLSHGRGVEQMEFGFSCFINVSKGLMISMFVSLMKRNSRTELFGRKKFYVNPRHYLSYAVKSSPTHSSAVDPSFPECPTSICNRAGSVSLGFSWAASDSWQPCLPPPAAAAPAAALPAAATVALPAALQQPQRPRSECPRRSQCEGHPGGSPSLLARPQRGKHSPAASPTASPAAALQPAVQQPCSQPYNQLCSQPYNQPCSQPYNQPCSQPYNQPCSQPYNQPCSQPYNQSCSQPYNQPCSQPYNQPCSQPYNQPCSCPTTSPAANPTTSPTAALQPVLQPALQPILQPSLQPILQPALQPTLQPSLQPSLQPTLQSSLQPSLQPTLQPSLQPTLQPALQGKRLL
ncbi:keratinocyte proline-rich protein-like [Tachyglossus aculeatus]|uniref:keratinocyte proline-rich protein-like n=1 Tax=Tachyglossus aculeatus TaxID=9261 RepID=UPI0018F2A695|nr:keratinocyte proline-rich protein-like [Tachyglossus aculeatus]